MSKQSAKSTFASHTFPNYAPICWMASTDLNQILWLCLTLRSARGEKTHRDFTWGAKRSLCFHFRARTAKWTWRNGPHSQWKTFFSLKNIHSMFLCRYCLHSHTHQWHGSFTPCLEPWIQDPQKEQHRHCRPLTKMLGCFLPHCFQNPFPGSQRTWNDTLGSIWA